ncbi:glycosyltransferase [Mycobacterium sp. CVI_P3]|uniref:Glycosyltransferase n=1 Tax=Mycobacterium pinniadriaticum TaxID=2994102 RepID=A0ABT3SHV7_9MYCO|nr:glycosyltransferase [Mycobacterium pinniadriaticum]MCX2932696.1 glycosyltransferase [Mycobacterium pinniadriaticum]MCX2939120.1 glycosyltransferase [Mycobacterium pinniadriaticum]
MTPGIRALVLIDAFRMGGAETLLAPMIVASRDTDVAMDVMSVSPAAWNSEKTMTILAEAGIATYSLGIRRLLDPVALPRLAGAIRRGHYDVVHAHLEMAMTLAVPAARLVRRPAVCTFHHVARPLEGRAAWRERLAVEAATRSRRALFVSEASLRSFAETYRPRAVPANWEVMHNGIDISNFAPGDCDPRLRAELGGGTDGPIVVLPAAFRDFKGIPVAIRAWPLVRRRFPGAVLALTGGGEAEEELRRLVAELELAESVIFAGVRTDMPAVYRAADVVLLPSTHGENLPTVLIEASATGRAIAASRIGGIPDIVLDGRTGLLFEPGSEQGLADAVCRLAGDPDLRRNLGAAAGERAREEFSAAAWMRRLRSTYLEAMGPRR